MIRKHIVFYGWVRGVGFRYRARHAADLYGCTGWVRNEYDGSVSMEIQGEEESIDRGTFMPEIVNEFLILTKGTNKINKADFCCLFAC